MTADPRQTKAPGSRKPSPGPKPSGISKQPIRSSGEESHLPWGRRNYRILAAGGVAVVLGFVLLALGDTLFAPILLVGGYLGLIPWGILAAVRNAGKTPGTAQSVEISHKGE